MPVAHLPVSVLRAVFVVLSLPVILGACKPEAKPAPQPRAVNVVKVVGDTVRKGQVLLRLDPVDRKLSVDAAGQQVAAAESNHRQAKAEF